MKSTESTKELIGRIKEIVNDMEINGEKLEEVWVVVMVQGHGHGHSRGPDRSISIST